MKVGGEVAFLLSVVHSVSDCALSLTKYSVPCLKRVFCSGIKKISLTVSLYNVVLGPQEVELGCYGVILLTGIIKQLSGSS